MTTSAVFRADDIAISRSTVLAARMCVERGVCRNVSVQAVGAHLDLVRELLVPLAQEGRCAIGIHVTVCCEWDAPRFRPVGRRCDPRLLDEDGAFVAHAGVMHERRVPGEAVVAEAEAQLDRLVAHGIHPTYADEHMGFGWVPSLAGSITGWARRHGLVDADRLRFANPPALPRQAGPVEDALARLAAVRGGVLRLIGHPVLPDNENGRFRMRAGLHADYDVNQDRDAQRRMFTDPRIVALVYSGAVESLRLDQLA
jgi:predicted glycoside hydrolase/deacetylase ChbG (UPF0249 family)